MTDTPIRELDYVCALDLETSGLDEQNDQVLEVAAIFGKIVDGKFVPGTTSSRRPHTVNLVLPLITDIEKWHEVVLAMHTSNGLLAEAIKAKKANGAWARTFDAVDQALDHAGPALPYKGKITLLGNSVHFDLRFVRRVFPRFAASLSHRVIDVSSTRLFCEGLGMVTEKADPPHRAMPDVLASIAQYERQGEWIRGHFTGPSIADVVAKNVADALQFAAG
jgi:oligoribonuclease